MITEKDKPEIPAGASAPSAPLGEKTDGRKTIGEKGGRTSALGRAPAWDERLVLGASFSNQVAESFRVLRARILHPHDGRPACRTVMVTSLLPREGKSFVSANLAIALAQGVDHHSLLVECDLRLPSVSRLFGISHEQGLADYLLQRRSIPELLQKTSLDKLTVLPSGMPPANPAELLASIRMQGLVAELAERYPDRVVVFDTPPYQIVSESAVLADLVDGVVLVVRHGVSSKLSILKMVEEIGRDKIIGLIFNGHENNVISSRLLYRDQTFYGDYYRQSGRV
jgi:exopolysaccharide/PEP-CTERM locus tyrosine autokinase